MLVTRKINAPNDTAVTGALRAVVSPSVRDLLCPDHYQISLPIPTTADVLSRLRNGILNCFHNEQLAGFVFALSIPPETDRKGSLALVAKRSALQCGQACVSTVQN